MSTKFNEETTDFALNLMNKIAKENEDLLFSPMSITLALAMCFAGSQGNTKAQLKKVIFGDIEDDSYLHESLNELVMSCNALQGFINCNVANRLYCRKSFAVLQTYRNLLQKSFKSDIISVDFNEKTRNEINQWVSKATHEKIKDILPSNSLDEVPTQLILISALYFKAEWNEQFEKKLTTKKKFYTTSDRIVDVDMMKLSHQFRYVETDDYQALSLSYASFRASMIIVLPKEKFGLKKLEENMSGSSFLQMVSSMQGAKVDLELPKIKFETGFSLNQPLKSVEISEAFNNEEADFSLITGDKSLCISEVMHKAFIDINENGTEAAGASGIKMITMSAIYDTREPKSFICDHPFMFAILNSDHNVLFLGHFFGSSV